MNRRWLLGTFVILVLVGVVLFVRAKLPSLIAISPGDSETYVAATSPLVLTFSEEMQPETVTQNLQIQPPTEGSFVWDANTLMFSPREILV